MNEASSITPAMSSVLALLALAINFPTDEKEEEKRLFDLLLSFSDAEMWAITNEPYSIIPHPRLSEPDAAICPLVIGGFLETKKLKNQVWGLGKPFGYAFLLCCHCPGKAPCGQFHIILLLKFFSRNFEFSLWSLLACDFFAT